MADDNKNKAVGPLAAAKQVALTKAALDKKLDKSGGTMTGDLTVRGAWINVESTDTSMAMLNVEGLAASRGAVIGDTTGDKAVSVECVEDNAARVTSNGSDGKSRYARLAVGTPTGDNDAATKAYVDGLVTGHEVITVTSTKVSDLGYDAEEGATKYSVTFDASFDSILANLAANKPMKFNIALPDGTGSMPISFNTGYFSALNNGMFAFTGSIAGAPIVLSIGGLGSAIVYLYADYLPAPNPDGSDDGKSLVVDGDEWAIKKTAIDDALSDTSTNPVQNKVVKAALDKKAGKDVATAEADGLMSAADKKKLDGVAEGANKTTVIDALDPRSNNPVASAALFEALSNKADRTEATEHAAGLMSAFDKRKLNGIEEGANKTIVDEMLSDGSANPVQNKAVTAALAAVVRETIYPIAVTATSAEWVVNNGIAYKEASADRTFDNIKAAYNGNKTPVCEFEGMTYSLILDSSTEFVFASYRGAVANDSQYTGLGKYPTSLITINTTGVVISRTAGDLPAVTVTDNGKMLIVAGGEWAMQRVPGSTVDAELSTTSENPVQNKTVTAALNDKLPKTGGTVTGALRTNDSFSAGGTIAFGAAPIGLSQTADGAAEIRSGSADVDDNPPPLARLKLASPTEANDAATKQYVDQSLDAPILTSPVMIRKERATDSAGVYLTTIGTGEKHAEIRLEDVNENAPVAIANLRTPTGAGTDNYAATKGYVDSKVASGGGGVTVDTAMSGSSNNPVANHVIKQYVDDKVAAGSNITVDAALSSTSTNPVQNKAVKVAIDAKADKTALDAKADKTALDAKMDKSGGTFTGNVYGKYFCGTWLQSSAASDLGRTPGKIAVLDDSGWVYYRTPAELLADIGAMAGGDCYTKAETDAAIAVRASTSAYGTTKLSNSTTSSSKTLAATPYAVKTALAQAKAYVDSAIAVAINSAY